MYKSKSHGFIKDMDKTELLKMREDGMTNKQIANALGCSPWSIINLIGKQPEWMTEQSIKEGREKRKQTFANRRIDGTPMPAAQSPRGGTAVREEEPKKCVLVVKSLPPMPIPLHGEFMDYVISADRTSVDVETEQGRCLLQIPMEKIDTFIAELNAIKRNASSGAATQFWG